MKNQELQERLAQFPDDWDVRIEGLNGDYDVDEVECYTYTTGDTVIVLS